MNPEDLTDRCYTGFMRSVADDLRVELAARDRARSPEARILRALALGCRDLDLYRATHGGDRATVRRRLRVQRQAGRRPSGCSAGLEA